MSQLFDATAPRHTEIFWGEISPCEHVVQIYSEDSLFMETLEGFVARGLESQESVIIIATEEHRADLQARLERRGVDVASALAADRYIPLDAEETLAKFMVAGWPDEARFQKLVTSLLLRARKSGKRVRAFGEMVAILWEQGHNGATVRLEHLWHSLCHTETFPLFCAYPKSGFTKNAQASIREICDAHSKVLAVG